MNYSETMSQLMGSIQKSINNNDRLNYFKNELLKILDKKEQAENNLSKSIDTYFRSLDKSLLNEFGIEKGRVGTIGEIRTWKDGKKYKKMPNGKWVRVYQQQNRSAEISIARLRGRIKNAQSVDELYEIVTKNIHRFEDENGQILPIIEELQKEVNNAKSRINAGKPSTKEQIEEYKKNHPQKSVYEDLESRFNEIDAEFKKITNIDYNYQDYEGMKAIKEKADKFLTDIAVAIREADRNGDFNATGKLEDLKYNNQYLFSKINSRFETVNNEHEKKQIENAINSVNIDNLTDEEWNGIRNFNDSLNSLIDKYKDGKDTWSLRSDLKDFVKNTTDIESGKRWLKLNGIHNFDELTGYARDKLNEYYNEKRRAAEKKKEEERNAKLDEINKNYKREYTKEEIDKAFADMEVLQKTELSDLQYRVRYLNKHINQVKHDMDKRQLEIHASNSMRPYDKRISLSDDETYNKLREDWLKSYDERKTYNDDIKKVEAKVDKLMPAIAYSYLNMDYEKDSGIEKCATTKDVVNLINNKDWYSDKGKAAINLGNMDVKGTKDVFKTLERVFAIFPEVKGSDYSLHSYAKRDRTFAYGGTSSGITFNNHYWSDYEYCEKQYEPSEGSFHPKGTKAKDIIYHEFYHFLTTKGDLAKVIKASVAKSLGMRGKKGGVKQDELIHYGVSEYALKNADEFGAECFCQALGAENPSAFALEVFKETIKRIKYMRGM